MMLRYNAKPHMGRNIALFILFTTVILITVFLVNPDQSGASSENVWCFDTVVDENGHVHQFGHPPGILPESSEYFSGATLKNIKCFTNWADVASFATDGVVILPIDATKEDYVRATEQLYARPGSPVLESMQ